MSNKVIVFDVDGVITDSWASKEAIIQEILEQYHLFDIPGVEKIFGIGLNRVLLLEKIYEIQEFDKKAVLKEINRQLAIQESQVELIQTTFDFIQKYYGEYIFFTNTSLPKSILLNIVRDLDIEKYFKQLLAYDEGSKKENIEYVMKEYDVTPKNILFIDDKMSHIHAVKDTWVHTLLFVKDWVSLEEKVKNIF